MTALFIALLALAAAPPTTAVSAAPTTASVDTASRQQALVFLQLARSPTERQRERRVSSEIALVLDGFVTFSVAPDDPNFSESPLAEQMQQVEPLVERYDAVAVAWLVPTSTGRLVLNLVAHQTGRFIAKTFDSAPGGRGRSAVTLALTLRSLLGTAYLFEPEARKRSPELERVVNTVRAEIGLPPTTVTPDSKNPWRVSARGIARGAISPNRGPWTAYGFWTAVTREIASGIEVGLGLSAVRGPSRRSPDFKLSGSGLAPELLAQWLWRGEPLELGLGLAAQSWWHRFEFDFESTRDHLFVVWQPGLRLDTSLTFRLADSFGAVLAGGAGWAPRRQAFLRRSTGRAALNTPVFAYFVGLGLTTLPD